MSLLQILFVAALSIGGAGAGLLIGHLVERRGRKKAAAAEDSDADIDALAAEELMAELNVVIPEDSDAPEIDAETDAEIAEEIEADAHAAELSDVDIPVDADMPEAELEAAAELPEPDETGDAEVEVEADVPVEIEVEGEISDDAIDALAAELPDVVEEEPSVDLAVSAAPDMMDFDDDPAELEVSVDTAPEIKAEPEELPEQNDDDDALALEEENPIAADEEEALALDADIAEARNELDVEEDIKITEEHELEAEDDGLSLEEDLADEEDVAESSDDLDAEAEIEASDLTVSVDNAGVALMPESGDSSDAMAAVSDLTGRVDTLTQEIALLQDLIQTYIAKDDHSEDPKLDVEESDCIQHDHDPAPPSDEDADGANEASTSEDTLDEHEDMDALVANSDETPDLSAILDRPNVSGFMMVSKGA